MEVKRTVPRASTPLATANDRAVDEFGERGRMLRMAEAVRAGVHRRTLAVPRDAEPPRVDHPPVRVLRVGPRAFGEGVETHTLDGVAVKVYSRRRRSPPASSTGTPSAWTRPWRRSAATAAEAVFREVCGLGVEPDGMAFDPGTVAGVVIKEDADYAGRPGHVHRDAPDGAGAVDRRVHRLRLVDGKVVRRARHGTLPVRASPAACSSPSISR